MSKNNGTVQEPDLDDFSFDKDDFTDFVDTNALANKTNQVLGEFEEDTPGSVTSLETVKEKKPEEVVIDTKPSKEKAPAETTPAKKKGKEKEDEDEEEEEDELNDSNVTDADFDFSGKPPKVEKSTTETSKEKGGKEKSAETPADDTDKDEGDEGLTEFAKGLKERGFFGETIVIPEDKQLTEDELFDLQEQEFNNRIEETITGMAKGNPEAKDLVKHLLNGGKVKDFVQVYADNTFDLPELDETNAKQVDKVLRYYVENYEDHQDQEDIEDRIKAIKDGGKAVANAVKWHKKILADDELEKTEFNKGIALAAENRQKAAKAMAETVTKTLKETTSVGAFPIGKGEASKIADFINKPSVKVGTNKFVPPLIAAISKTLKAGSKEEIERLIVLGKLYLTNFAPDDLITEVETKVATGVQKGIAKGKMGFKGRSSGIPSGSKSLAEYFDS